MCARKTCLSLAVRMSLSERNRAIPVFPYFFSTGNPGPGRGRIGILTTRFSSSAKAVECGRSTERLSMVKPETSS